MSSFVFIVICLFVCFTDEWDNFLERIYPKKENREARKALLKTIFPKEFKLKSNEKPRVPDDLKEEVKLELRLWASYRGQTLARTGQWCICDLE